MGKLHAVQGAIMICSSGSAQAVLLASGRKTKYGGAWAANILDHKPGENIPSFGRCGILNTSCTPDTPSPWVPFLSTVHLSTPVPGISEASTLVCKNGGTITIIQAGQNIVRVANPRRQPGMCGPMPPGEARGRGNDGEGDYWCGADASGPGACGAAVGACGAAASGYSACGAAASACGAAASGASACGAQAGACGVAASGGSACGADATACGAAASGVSACGANASACGAAASGASACGANVGACGVAASGAEACGVATPCGADGCGADGCAVDATIVDACIIDVCAVDVIPVLPFI